MSAVLNTFHNYRNINQRINDKITALEDLLFKSSYVGTFGASLYEVDLEKSTFKVKRFLDGGYDYTVTYDFIAFKIDEDIVEDVAILQNDLRDLKEQREKNTLYSVIRKIKYCSFGILSGVGAAFVSNCLANDLLCYRYRDSFCTSIITSVSCVFFGLAGGYFARAFLGETYKIC